MVMERRGANPFELPEHKGWSISAYDAPRLTRITKHCVVSFLCRYCGYYGPDWAEALNKWWILCYSCGAHYQPGVVEEGTESLYSKVIALKDPITKQVQHLPALWLVTQDDKSLAAQAEVCKSNIQSIEDLEDSRTA